MIPQTDEDSLVKYFPHRSGKFAIVAMTLLGLICIGVPMWQLLTYQPYDFALTLPQTWQGGIEALVLFTLLASAQRIRYRGACFVIVFLVAELYLRRHAVDVSAIVDLIYFEILVGIGVVLATRMDPRAERNVDYYLRAFVLGICLWSVCAWGLSAVGIGSVKALRVLTALLGLSLLIFRPKPLSVFVIERALEMTLRQRILIAAFAAWFLVLFAKTGVAMNFDALWYSLRGDHMLVGEGSVFKSAGLVSSVHYFPKLYELILIPVSGLGISSVIAGISIFVLATLALACYEAARYLGVESRGVRLLIALTCISVPAISNSAVDPKPELLAVLFALLAWIYAGRFIENHARGAALWAVACGILATQTKLVAIPFVSAMTLATVFFAIRYRTRAISGDANVPDHSSGIIAASLAVLVGIFVTARTLILAGVPTIGPDALVNIWRALDLNFKFPTGTMNWIKPADWSDAPQLILDVLFRPPLAGHHLTYWNGNLWLWAALVIPFLPRLAVASREQTRALFVIGLSIAACGLLLLVGISYGVRGGDGNYYIIATIAATLLGLTAIARRLPASRFMYACLIAFCAFHMSFGFVSADWMTGTRAFDFKLNRGIHEFRTTNRHLLHANGLETIDRYLRHLHRPARVIGCMDDNLDMRLSARTESIQQIAYSRLDFLTSPTAFFNFLQDDKIDFLIAPAAGNVSAHCYDIPAVHDAIDALANDDRIDQIGDSSYVMYDLARWSKLRQR